MLSPQLEGFQRKNDYLYNFRCPYCGDSHKKKSKKRGYVYRKSSGLFFMCHNCGTSTTLGNLIKFVSPSLHKQYVVDEYKDANYGRKRSKKEDVKKAFNIPKPKFDTTEKPKYPTIYSLPDDNEAKQYVVSRQIPVKYQKEMFLVDDFKSYVNEVLPDNEYHLVDNDERIVIPMKTRGGILVGFQGRAVGKRELRYITIKVREDLPKIFGMDKVDIHKRIYVVEGPIDSMFLPNAIAMAGSDFNFDLDKKNATIVLDNEKRNKEITRRMYKLVEEGYSICIWPDDLREKDINDMILSGKSSEEVLYIIDQNTYSGLSARLRLNDWTR